MPSLDRHGVRIAYEVHGDADGTPLLLSHGYGASSACGVGTSLPSLPAGGS